MSTAENRVTRVTPDPVPQSKVPAEPLWVQTQEGRSVPSVPVLCTALISSSTRSGTPSMRSTISATRSSGGAAPPGEGRPALHDLRHGARRQSRPEPAVPVDGAERPALDGSGARQPLLVGCRRAGCGGGAADRDHLTLSAIAAAITGSRASSAAKPASSRYRAISWH
jgi:hypothetical protein